MEILTGQKLPRLHDRALCEWYESAPLPVEAGPSLESVILAQHFCNYTQWNLEDEVRRENVPDSYLVKLKRAIDASNQRRNNLMERIDEWILERLNGVDLGLAQLHSETAGMMVDRLSILALKIHHMRLNSTRILDSALAAECARKAETLLAQRTDLMSCLESTIADFAAGQRYFKIYRQFKSYNDPRLNPALRD